MDTQSKNGSLWIYFLLAFLLISSAVVLQFIFRRYINVSSAVLDCSDIRAIIIDPGHGGKDGGAISVTGKHEKSLNLDYSLNVAEFLHILGYDVIMTRSTDTELTVSGSSASRKMQDLQGRLLIAQSHPDTRFISIHMNKFPAEKYRGLQVYYSKNHPISKELAALVQSKVKQNVQNDNDRAIKNAGSAIFLLDKIKSPAILIECGFLSNQDEATLLEDPLYRSRLCISISLAIASYTAS